MKKEIAILMAAGKGERMRPVTETTPKPLVKVNGVSMIETVIKGLEHRGITEIYVVVGYLGEKFSELKAKYPNITIIENKEYTIKNNISSMQAACNVLGKADCFICEADLVVSDETIFDKELNQSGYYGKFVAGHSDDWVFDQDENGRITRIGKYGDDQYNMCGLCYLKEADALIMRDALIEAANDSANDNLFWDQILDRNLDKINLTVYPVTDEQIVEIDSVKELVVFDKSYEKYLA